MHSANLVKVCYNMYEYIKKVFYMQIKPSKQILDKWIDELFAKYDIWFFVNAPKFKNIQILSIEEYLKEYENYNNYYFHWNVSNNAKYVVVDKSNWLKSLTNKEKFFVYAEQVKLDRGLIIENYNHKKYESMIYENNIILSKQYFNNLSRKDKIELTTLYANQFDEWVAEKSVNLPTHLNDIANSFVENDGFNCLALTLYALTKDKKYLTKWVLQEEFEKVLKERNYTLVKNKLIEPYSVIVFTKENEIVHASYLITNKLVINKNGQLKYNPITIKKLNKLVEEWDDCEYQVYTLRRENILSNERY